MVKKRPKDGLWALLGEEAEEESQRRREGGTREVGGEAGDSGCPGSRGQRALQGGGRCPVANTADGLREGSELATAISNTVS